ncbi:MAG TPA: DUF3325 domain-containing protein [Hydrogenophaga sp.]
MLLSIASFGAFALGMERHQRAICHRKLGNASTWTLRAVGGLGLTTALFVAVRGPDMALGLVAWFGHISLAAGTVFLALAVRPQQGGSSRKSETVP